MSHQVLKNAGFASVLEGLSPDRASEEALEAETAGQLLLRIPPTGIANSTSDPGGAAWVWGPVCRILLVAVIVVLVR